MHLQCLHKIYGPLEQFEEHNFQTYETRPTARVSMIYKAHQA